MVIAGADVRRIEKSQLPLPIIRTVVFHRALQQRKVKDMDSDDNPKRHSTAHGIWSFMSKRGCTGLSFI